MAPFSKTLQMIGPCSLFFFSFLRRSPLKKATAENKLAQGNVILFLKDCILPGSFSTRGNPVHHSKSKVSDSSDDDDDVSLFFSC